MPFLPGDSLLFAASAIAARPRYNLNIWIFALLFLIACLGGDSLNFLIGHKIGKTLSNHSLFGKLINKESSKSEAFFERHGAPAIILARFMPIIRTFAPLLRQDLASRTALSIQYHWLLNLGNPLLWFRLLFGNLPLFKNTSR